MKCKRCGSYAINHHCHGRDGSDPDLCDVCYWRKRADGDRTTEELNVIYEIRQALDAMHMDLAELPEECRRLKVKVLEVILERDRYQFQAEQKWRLRRELDELLGIPEELDSDEALRVAVEKIRAMKEGK